MPISWLQPGGRFPFFAHRVIEHHTEQSPAQPVASAWLERLQFDNEDGAHGGAAVWLCNLL
jgi:hypothetical protein